ncbi:MAG: hypothetical protein KBG48_18035 [Kofleriaceae bacterium]|jgi:hypothetical protein|nr:hypothetical protein [Kofleriaceae bacterium]MBP9169304.1 hypothetical protein [Kofleriaceae bacterium]MBP9861113.1 hypothetical protein [Kofleriaceae bacterium]
MAVTAPTARDRLDRLFLFIHRASRYWWLTVAIMIIGGAASAAFAMSRPKLYTSGAVLYYQERLQTSLLQGRDVSTMHRNIGERYRELLLARSSLVEIIRDPALNPFPEVLAAEGEDAAVEELRPNIGFRPRGANTFVISYQDSDPDRAKAVTQKLTMLLRDKAAAVRVESAQATAKFAVELRTGALDELRVRQRRLNEFLVAHPEFVVDANAAGSAEGAAVRALQDRRTARPTTDPATTSVLQALERQRARIKARIENPDAPIAAPTPVRRERTPEQVAADQKVAEVEREVAAANRRLEDAQSKFTDRHPDVLSARDNLTAAQARLKAAKAAVPPDAVAVDDPLPSTPVDPAQLQKLLTDVERQIAAERARRAGSGGGSAAPAPDAGAAAAANSVVKLEDDYQQLKLDVDEQKQRVDSLADSAFRAELEAQQRIAEQGDSLSIVDGAYRPLRPSGQPKRKLVMMGLVVFTMLGAGLAVALALLDDRVYHRDDLMAVSPVPVLAMIPRGRRRRWWFRRR